MEKADFSKVAELIEMISQKFEIERKKKEMEEEFIEVFGLEPKVVNVNSAETILRDNELPSELSNKIRRLLDDLGLTYDCFDLHLEVYRTEYENNYDWKADIVGSSITLVKVKNEIKYKLQILAIWEDRI